MEFLIETLEKSVNKHGEHPLTNKGLLNILKIVERQVGIEIDYSERFDYGASDDIF